MIGYILLVTGIKYLDSKLSKKFYRKIADILILNTSIIQLWKFPLQKSIFFFILFPLSLAVLSFLEA